MRNILTIILLILTIILAPREMNAQNAPLTICDSVMATGPGTVNVPVTIQDFNNIGALSLTIDYDYSVIQFLQGTPHPSLPTLFFGDQDLGNGFHRISMGWFGNGTNLPDGTVLLTLTFNYTDGTTQLTWYDDGVSCEYADGSYNVLNDIPAEDYYFDGFVCGTVPAPGTIYGNDMVCAGEQEVAYSVDELANASGYYWSVPEGATITSGQYTNGITVDYSENAVSGMIEVYGYNECGDGLSSQVAVTVNELPVADAGDDLTINYGTSTTLSAAPGGAGSYSYHWYPEDLLEDPLLQNPQTVILTSTTIFTVVVTDLATLCENSDEVTVTITGGPLNVNPTAIPAFICQGESTQLYANAGGGSGDYTYEWSSIPPGSPPWSSNLANPIVSPETSTQYSVNVFDGFTTTMGTTSVTVSPLPTGTISGGDTLCGSGITTDLTVDLTGTPPWDFIYSFGSTSVNVYNVNTTPYFITTGSPGTYVISYVEDVNCSGMTYGSATVNVFPVPATPEVSVNGTELTSSACCGNQWHLNGNPIPGATEQTYIALVSGDYFTIVTLNGCSSDTSEVVDVIVGVVEKPGPAFRVYPNPAREQLFIELDACTAKDPEVRLLNLQGRTLQVYQFKGSTERAGMDLNGLAPGMYLLELNLSSRVYHQKIIIY